VCSSGRWGGKESNIIIQSIVRPEILFDHIFEEDFGILVTMTGQQARFTDPGARQNELAAILHRFWEYPAHRRGAAEHLIAEAQRERESYFGVHLYREKGNRRSRNAAPTVRCLWLDEDGGAYSEEGPEPTFVVYSSESRRHLYWLLTHPVAIEWAVGMNRRIAAWAGGDSGKAGTSSVLRAPGTANFKRHPQIDLVVGEFTSTNPWEPEVLDQAIPVAKLEPSTRAATEFSPNGAATYSGPDFDLLAFLARAERKGALEVTGRLDDGLGIAYSIVCPWVHEHSGGDRTGTRVGQRSGGGAWFHCDHDHCRKAGRRWQEFKAEIRRRAPEVREVKKPGFSGMSWEVTHD
jgi:hypothetical protein